MPTDDAHLDAELQALVAAGRKIEAIKRYRKLTGVGLILPDRDRAIFVKMMQEQLGLKSTAEPIADRL